LNPAAPQSAAIRGEPAALPELGPATAAPLPPLAEDQRGPIRATRLHLPESIDWAAFTLWLSALLHARSHDLVRIRGVVRTPAGRLLPQTVRRVVQSPEILPEGAGEDGTLVFIGRGFTAQDLARSLHRFASVSLGKTAP
jgi:G3E family GTPase